MVNNIKYTHKKSLRARHIRLVVHCDGSVVVTSPYGVRGSMVERFVDAKKKWVLDKIKIFKSEDRQAVRPYTRKDYLENKNRAMELISERVEYYCQIYGLSYNRISIRNQSSLWGSCSRRRNLNLNYKIIFLPRRLQDYIIVHEVCHIRELNHSHRFWTLVAKAVPDFLARRKELRGHRLR